MKKDQRKYPFTPTSLSAEALKTIKGGPIVEVEPDEGDDDPPKGGS